MSVLVTGGLGLVGAHLVPRLLARGPVIVLDNHSVGAVPDAFTGLGPGLHVVDGDAADAELVESLMARADTVVHLAARTSVDRSIEDPSPCTIANVAATAAVVDAACRRRPARFVHVSTDEVWGSIPAPHMADETTPYAPNNPYAASKAACDHIVRAANNTYGLGATTVYFTTLYGPWQLPGKLIGTAAHMRLRGQPVPIFGDGQGVREYTYITDAVDGLLAALDHGQTGEGYVIGSGHRHSTLAVVEAVNRLAGGGADWATWAAERPGHDHRYAVDSTKARRQLGWAPATGFEDGLAATIDWYRHTGLALASGSRHHARRPGPTPAADTER